MDSFTDVSDLSSVLSILTLLLPLPLPLASLRDIEDVLTSPPQEPTRPTSFASPESRVVTLLDIPFESLLAHLLDCQRDLVLSSMASSAASAAEDKLPISLISSSYLLSLSSFHRRMWSVPMASSLIA